MGVNNVKTMPLQSREAVFMLYCLIVSTMCHELEISTSYQNQCKLLVHILRVAPQ